jgi:hypothetical protein
LVPQPLIAFTTPVHVTAERFGRIPKFYIQCLQDRILSPSLQAKMAKTTPCEKIFSLNTDHSPFLSVPDELAAQLFQIASWFSISRHKRPTSMAAFCSAQSPVSGVVRKATWAHCLNVKSREERMVYKKLNSTGR